MSKTQGASARAGEQVVFAGVVVLPCCSPERINWISSSMDNNVVLPTSRLAVLSGSPKLGERKTPQMGLVLG